MHPAFRLSNLDRLPATLRNAAKIACSPNATVHDLLRVRTYMATATDKQHNLLLPVFYVNLDPAGVPNEAQLDTDSLLPEVTGRIGKALRALEALYIVKFAVEIGPDIWPRVWAWVQFLHLYRRHLPGITVSVSGRVLCLDLLMFAGTFADHPRTHALMLATPGFRYMVAKAWVYLPDIQDPKKREVMLTDLRAFFADEHAADAAPLAELIDGSGGTLTDLAWLVVAYIDAAVPEPGTEMDYLYIHLLVSILGFVAKVEPRLAEPTQIHEPLGPFGAALFSQEIVPALCNAARAASTASASQTHFAFHLLLVHLSVMIYQQPAHECITQALENQLLLALVTCAQGPLGRKLQHQLGIFFGAFLPGALVYYRVLAVMDNALAEVAELVKRDGFKASPIYDKWHTFHNLANQRLDLRDVYDDGEYPTQKACDNLKCTEMDHKFKFRRCAGCFSAYYCSRPCQKADWREGGHRGACEAYCTLYFKQERDVHLGRRQRSFLRVLVQHDYNKMKAVALTQQIVFKQQKPGEPFVTVYKYALGAADIEVRPLSGAVLPGYGSAWTDILARVAGSGGRMLLDVVTLGQGAGARQVVLPMRTNTTALHDKLQTYFATLPADRELWVQEEISPQLEAVIYEGQPGVVVIH
ncbi:hypothetical protein C8R43DRAFT_1040121 [Mycena crocata]|nr:hypothetical protein C8R43DRAFT_1040121 [Mycena crocata]